MDQIEIHVLPKMAPDHDFEKLKRELQEIVDHVCLSLDVPCNSDQTLMQVRTDNLDAFQGCKNVCKALFYLSVHLFHCNR